jgi:methionyl-tRNA synthetase
VQFLAKDNVPFHAVSFPATLLGSGLPFKLVDTIKGFNWLTFEGGKFSTSAGHGIFTDTALALLPADTWRWWLAANAPRRPTAISPRPLRRRREQGSGRRLRQSRQPLPRLRSRAFGGVVPEAARIGPLEHRLAGALDEHLAQLRRHHESLALRKAADEVRAIWRLANAYLAEAAPWSAIRDDSARAATIINTGIHLVRVSALAAWPFIPSSAEKVLCSLGEEVGIVPWPQDALSAIPAGRRIAVPPLLFPKITPSEHPALHA